jgi:hypothetical protein
VLSIPDVEGSQGGRIRFSDEPTEPLIEDASAQALDADKVLLEVAGKLIEAAWHRPMASLLLGIDGLIVEMDHHPQQVGDRVLEARMVSRWKTSRASFRASSRSTRRASRSRSVTSCTCRSATPPTIAPPSTTPTKPSTACHIRYPPLRALKAHHARPQPAWKKVSRRLTRDTSSLMRLAGVVPQTS